MTKYFTFLRGINISGKNKIAMPQLKAAFEKNGFAEVATYINSGNVLFSSEEQNRSELIESCERLIRENFNLSIPVAILEAEELEAALKHAPDWWNQEQDVIHYAIFMIPPITAAEVFAAVGEIKPEYEQIAAWNEVIFWSAPRKTFNKARWSKIASSSVNTHVTIRNAKTVNKLVSMNR